MDVGRYVTASVRALELLCERTFTVITLLMTSIMHLWLWQCVSPGAGAPNRQNNGDTTFGTLDIVKFCILEYQEREMRILDCGGGQFLGNHASGVPKCQKFRFIRILESCTVVKCIKSTFTHKKLNISGKIYILAKFFDEKRIYLLFL